MRWIAAAGALALTAACNPAPPTPDGARLYDENCAVCHGQYARGDGVLAADLPVPPADLTRLSARNGGIFPAERVITQVFGYPGRFQSHAMPEFGAVLAGQPVPYRVETGEEVATPAAIAAITDHLKTLQQE